MPGRLTLSNFLNRVRSVFQKWRGRAEPAPTEPASPSNPAEVEAANGVKSASEDFKCPICLEIMINVAHTDCSHRFCKHCIETWFNQHDFKICPSCRSNVRSVTQLPDTEEEIDRFVLQHFTEAQKLEREALKSFRENCEIMRLMGILSLSIINATPPGTSNSAEMESVVLLPLLHRMLLLQQILVILLERVRRIIVNRA